MTEHYCVMSGNPADGFTVFGPFDTNEDAIDFANEIPNDYWWVLELKDPKSN